MWRALFQFGKIVRPHISTGIPQAPVWRKYEMKFIVKPMEEDVQFRQSNCPLDVPIIPPKCPREMATTQCMLGKEEPW
jgi:hypothetical protein